MNMWREYGYSSRDAEYIESFNEDSTEYYENLYIDARRAEFYAEFYQYLKENEIDPFEF